MINTPVNSGKTSLFKSRLRAPPMLWVSVDNTQPSIKSSLDSELSDSLPDKNITNL